uniref:Uncharacterized protein n=1 Tax=Meloidogyne incognita TaxID=6306 RepID=A0A914KI37_MELIC
MVEGIFFWFVLIESGRSSHFRAKYLRPDSVFRSESVHFVNPIYNLLHMICGRFVNLPHFGSL